MILRDGRDDDSDGIIALITSCWGEYPGVLMDVDGENPELRALASYFAKLGGALWIHEQHGAIAGMVATKPIDDGWELCRMYVAPGQRGSGIAPMLVNKAEDYARAHGGQILRLWTDTRFDRAHRFYERLGFVRDGGIRPLLDISNSLEFGYAKPIAGLVVRRFDTAAAASAARSLGRLLKVCVDAGDVLGFLPPLVLDLAQSSFRQTATQIAAGRRILLAAWAEATLVGTATINLDMPPNQHHRAEIEQLLVHPANRRQGLGALLMQHAVHEAATCGRTLLTLDVPSLGAAEALCRHLDWINSGTIPNFAVDAQRGPIAVTRFYRSTATG